jgi:CDP-diacylglycerol--serine O-phosphatidyltransferase
MSPTRNMIKVLPTVITALAAFFGVVAVVQVTRGNIDFALVSAICGMICDSFDGYLARMFGLESKFGAVMDSLVDVVLYLIVPILVLIELGYAGVVAVFGYGVVMTSGIYRLIRYARTGVTIMNGKHYFTGLPVVWVLALAVMTRIISHNGIHLPSSVFLGTLFLLSVLMVSTVPFRRPKKPTALSIFLLTLVCILGVLHFYGA